MGYCCCHGDFGGGIVAPVNHINAICFSHGLHFAAQFPEFCRSGGTLIVRPGPTRGLWSAHCHLYLRKPRVTMSGLLVHLPRIRARGCLRLCEPLLFVLCVKGVRCTGAHTEEGREAGLGEGKTCTESPSVWRRIHMASQGPLAKHAGHLSPSHWAHDGTFLKSTGKIKRFP